MWVDLAERKVAEDEPELVAERALDLLHDRIGRAAVGTLVVSVLDERHRRIGIALDVVALADRHGQPRMFAAFPHAGAGAASSSSARRMPSAPGLTSTGET